MFRLPLFPLHTVLFPQMPLHLHIFEDRYRIMIRRCVEENLPFGVVLIHKGREVRDENVETYPIGCTARLTNVEPLQNGHLNIAARGESRFRILEIEKKLPYLQAKVEAEPLKDEEKLDQLPGFSDIPGLFTRYLDLVGKIGNVRPDFNKVQMPENPLNLLYLAASVLQLPAHEKQPLLEADDPIQLYNQVSRLYRRENAVLTNLFNLGGQEMRGSYRTN